MKRVLMSMGHPAQYHFFKHTARRLMKEGYEVKMVIKTKDVLEQLLKEDGWEYVNVQEKMRKNNKLSILIASLKRSWAVIKIARKYKPDILLGTGADVAHAGWLLRKPCVTTLEDDIEGIRNLTRMTYPFTNDILVPIPVRVGEWEKKKIGYAGYMKLAYLHPNEFTPDRNILKKYGIEGKYILIRMVRLTAYHDVNVKGLNKAVIDNILRIAETNGYKVYISSENEIREELRKYQLKIKSTDIHHIMYYTSLLISDSQSMSVEAAMLGVPNIRFNDFAGRVSVLEELQNDYHLTLGIMTNQPQKLVNEVEKALSNPNIRDEFKERRQKMLNNKIDVTAFLTWYIKDYPQSRDIMKQNPNFQYKFK